MSAIDGLLGIVVTQEAHELHLAVDHPPRILRGDDERILRMPATSPETMRSLVGDLLTPHEATLRTRGTAAFRYRSGTGTDFDVVVRRTTTPDSLEVRFTRRTTAAAATRDPDESTASAGSASTSRAAPASGAGTALPRVLGAVVEAAAALRASDVHLTEGAPPIVRVDGELRPLRGVETPDVAALLPRSGPARRRARRARRSISGSRSPASAGCASTSTQPAAASPRRSASCARDAPRLAELHLPAGGAVPGRPAARPRHRLRPDGLRARARRWRRWRRRRCALRPRLLITLEDPIEYRIPPGCDGGLVRQREIGRDVSDFPTGLRDALREDPDILLIGEMRDAETIGLALTAAETGHLVLASLHSRTSASAIERIVDAYPPERQRQIRVQLADALRAVVAQRLLPRADGGGRVAGGRVPARDPRVANLIREGKTPQIPTAMQCPAARTA